MRTIKGRVAIRGAMHFPGRKGIGAALLMALGVAASATAYANDNHWYVFAEAGKTAGAGDKAFLDNELVRNGQSGFHSSMPAANVYKIGIGLRLTDYWAMEGGYLQSKSVIYTASGGTLSSTVSAPNLISGGFFDMVGILPLTREFSVVVRLGAVDMLHTAAVYGLNTSGYFSGAATDLTYGVGAQYGLTHTIAVRADLDRYDVGYSFSPAYCTVWTLGLSYGF